MTAVVVAVLFATGCGAAVCSRHGRCPEGWVCQANGECGALTGPAGRSSVVGAFDWASTSPLSSGDVLLVGGPSDASGFLAFGPLPAVAGVDGAVLELTAHPSAAPSPERTIEGRGTHPFLGRTVARTRSGPFAQTSGIPRRLRHPVTSIDVTTAVQDALRRGRRRVFLRIDVTGPGPALRFTSPGGQEEANRPRLYLHWP